MKEETPARRRYQQSVAFRQNQQLGLEKAWAVFKAAPRCGATKRSTGEPCRGYALKNGRCRHHGGRTPKGQEWHKIQWSPSKDANKLNRKSLDIARRERRRNKKQLTRTPEELAAYEAWKAAHRATSTTARARARQDRDAHESILRLCAEEFEND
ncbi:hypothetical protein [Methylobacterium sp. WL116]|uniref:hypothetical protein n=1 Tax=Methylobacterium sp. WL116 TaxID=2603889 RepID=UPI0011CAF63B|nr:hypothetical protein [Methylobacterium sp. WL116]TXM94678.1 hypothetical protein FV223_03790 [Methylobacterium sp. WL116]